MTSLSFQVHPGPQRGLGLAHPHIYPISDLQELVKGLVLGNNTHRIPMTWGGPDEFW